MLLAALLAAACAVLAALAAAQWARLRAVPSPGRVEALAAEAAELRARLAGTEAALAAERAAGARGEHQTVEAVERAAALAAEVAALGARLAVAEAALAAERAAAAERLGAQRSAAADLLEAERAAAADRLRSLEKAQREADARMAERFSALSTDALERSSTSFLQLAEQHLSRQRAEGAAELDARATAVAGLISPVAEVLQQVQERMQRLEVSRAEADTAVLAQVQALSLAQRELRAETANLVTALRAPAVRGRWGELQLRRVVEVAGMVRHCDFDEQVRGVGPDGAGVRPDLVVRLAGGKSVVVDAKVPLQAFLQATEATDEPARRRSLADHARQVRAHVDALAAKGYQQAFDP
ncbi:MAG: DNA recombination protein RmuC, partial [Acidimicrobiales bacterium]